MISACIANLGRYNAGVLAAEFLKLPTDEGTVQALLSRIGVDGKRYEEIVITDFETDVPGLLPRLVDEYADIDELNYLASLLDGLDKSDLQKYEAALSLGEYTGSMKDLINLAQNLDCYDFYPGVNNEEDLGYYLIDECDALTIPENIKGYFDYEAYGRDAFLNSTSDFAAGGYIENNGASFIEHYDGREVPEEYRVFSYPEEAARPSILETIKQFQAAPPQDHGGGRLAAAHDER